MLSRPCPPDLRSPPGASLRVALYGHDTYGLGHLRRNLRIAALIRRSFPTSEVLLLTGSPRAYAFPTPPGVSLEKLPSVTKDEAGRYVSLQAHVPLSRTVNDRRARIRQAIRRFRPQVLLVDHSPVGLRGELLPLLADLRREGGTRMVAGMRDVLDQPERVRRDWRRSGTGVVLEHLFDEVWVYGDPEVVAIHADYGMSPALQQRVRYLGYLPPPPGTYAVEPPALAFPAGDRPHVLCMTGGGADGEVLARTFLAMLANSDAWNGTLITGPFLPKPVVQALDAEYGRRPHIQILRFTGEIERLIAASHSVVSMGGYNTVVETLTAGRRLLVVPRCFPRQEQWLRARALERRHVLRMLEPDRLDVSSLRAAVSALHDREPPASPSDQGIRWNGLEELSRNLGRLLTQQAVEASP